MSQRKPEIVTVDDFKSSVNQALRRYGGPVQFLQESITDRATFAQELLTLCPPRQDVVYTDVDGLKKSHGGGIIVHPAQLGYELSASSKAAPYLRVSLQLVDMIFAYGFVSEGDPLRVLPESFLPESLRSTQAGQQQQTQLAFHIGYVKGHARASTLLSILKVAADHGIDLSQMAPRIFATCSAVNVLVSRVADPKAVAFENARLSVRGSIRQKPDVYCWMQTLRKLQLDTGASPSATLTEWNAESPEEGAIDGEKYSAVLNLLNMPAECLALIMEHVSKFGSEHGFTQDAFSNKKLVLGYQPPKAAKMRTWQSRLTVTAASQRLMLAYVIADNEAKPTRKKIEKAVLEQASQFSAVVEALIGEMLSQYPIADSEVNELRAEFVNQSMELEMELSQEIHSCRANAVFTDFSMFQAIVKKHLASNSTLFKGPTARTTLSADNLEQDELDLLLKSMAHDVNIFLAWAVRHDAADAAAHFEKLRKNRERYEAAERIAQEFMSDKHVNFKVALLDLSHKTGDAVWAEIQKVLDHIIKINSMDPSGLRIIITINWTAASLHRAEIRRTQASVAGLALKSDKWSAIGSVLMPAWTRQKGQLHTAESMVVKALTNHSLNMDSAFALQFAAHNDARETRPLLLIGRILTFLPPATKKEKKEESDEDDAGALGQLSSGIAAVAAEGGDADDGSGSARASKRRAIEAPVHHRPVLEAVPLPTLKDMVAIEDPNPNTLPSSTDADAQLNPAERVQQIGVPMAMSWIKGFIFGSDASKPDSKRASVIVDLTAHTCDVARAVLSLKTTSPTYYIGCCGSDLEYRWACDFLLDWTTDELLNPEGVLKMKVPDSEASATPEKIPLPPLTTLLWNAKVELDGKPTLKIPPELHRKWGERLADFCKSHENIVDVDPTKADAAATTRPSLKRGVGDITGESGIGKSPKPANSSSSNTLELDSIGLGDMSTLLYESPIIGSGSKKASGVAIAVGTNKTWYLINRTTSTVSLPKHTKLVGWYKGDWSQDAPDASGSSIAYDITPDSVVFLGNRLVSVLATFKEKRTENIKAAKICFYDVEEKPTAADPGNIILKQKQQIYFKVKTDTVPAAADSKKKKKEKKEPEEGGAGGPNLRVLADHLGQFLPPSNWCTKVSSITWNVQWVQSKGLQPRRPYVCLTEDVEVPAQAALKF